MTKEQLIAQLELIGSRQGEAMKRKDRALSDKFNAAKWDTIRQATSLIGEVKAYEIYTEAYRQASGFYN